MKRALICLVGLLSSCAATKSSGVPRVRQVVLVHGFGETGSMFTFMKERLERHGIECYVPRMTPADGRGGLERLARNLKADIDRKFGPDSRVAVIGFSMGGIVARYYLQNLGGAGRCEMFMTLASPHHGTRLAWFYPSQGAVEMRPGSPFLADLQAGEHRLGSMPVVSYRTPLDLIILPSTSSVWERAENLAVPAAMHPLLVSSDRVISDIERRLVPQQQ